MAGYLLCVGKAQTVTIVCCVLANITVYYSTAIAVFEWGLWLMHKISELWQCATICCEVVIVPLTNSDRTCIKVPGIWSVAAASTGEMLLTCKEVTGIVYWVSFSVVSFSCFCFRFVRVQGAKKCYVTNSLFGTCLDELFHKWCWLIEGRTFPARLTSRRRQSPLFESYAAFWNKRSW